MSSRACRKRGYDRKRREKRDVWKACGTIEWLWRRVGSTHGVPSQPAEWRHSISMNQKDQFASLSLLACKFHNINSIRMSGNADILFKETVSLWRHGGSSRREGSRKEYHSRMRESEEREKESDTKCFRIFNFQISFVTKRKICERFRETCEEYLCLGKFIRQFLFPKPRRNNLILKIFWY